MQLRLTIVDFPKHLRDAFIDRGMVRAVARDKLLNDCPQCLGRQLLMRNKYGMVLWSANNGTGAVELGNPLLRQFPSRPDRRVASRAVPAFIKWRTSLRLFSLRCLLFLDRSLFLALVLVFLAAFVTHRYHHLVGEYSSHVVAGNCCRSAAKCPIQCVARTIIGCKSHFAVGDFTAMMWRGN